MFLSFSLHADTFSTGLCLILGNESIAKENTGFFNPEDELQFANSVYAPNFQAAPYVEGNALEEDEEEEEKRPVKSSACTIAWQPNWTA